MLVSIIIPVYNVNYRYFSECLESALSQTFRPKCEIIIVDDGSTDDTTNYLKHCRQDKKFKIIFKNDNGGPASALNAGIKASSGEWIKWLSADDVLEPDAIEKMVAYLIMDRYNWRKSIYYTHYRIIDKDGKFIKKFTKNVNLAMELPLKDRRLRAYTWMKRDELPNEQF